MIPATELDQLLLSFCDVHWLKVARIVGKTLQTCEEHGVQISAEAIDARMTVLVGTRQLEAKGDIRNWRYSEVRLPAVP